MMDDLDFFNVGTPYWLPNQFVVAFFHHRRDDGWEKVLFAKTEECGYCGAPVVSGWLEMECDAIRCGACVPTERTWADGLPIVAVTVT
jgi:hypothetical protein